MASTLTRRNAEVSLKALLLGAADYIPKPESTLVVSRPLQTFRRELIEKNPAARVPEKGARQGRSAVPRIDDTGAGHASGTVRATAEIAAALLIGEAAGGAGAVELRHSPRRRACS